MKNIDKSKRIAVIGAGVAGLTSAYLLSRKYTVDLYEKNDYIGGHTNTVTIETGPDRGLAVDTGFIVFNYLNYPLFSKLLKELEVPVNLSDMSFSYWNHSSGHMYGSDLPWGMLANGQNILKPRFYSMVKHIFKFHKNAYDLASKNDIPDITLGEYLTVNGYSKAFQEDYLLPMTASIWSCSSFEAREFPLRAFLSFWKNHGLLQLKNRPDWYTVDNGAVSYIRKILPHVSGNIHLATPVESVVRFEDRVTVKTALGEKYYDQVVLACHADEAHQILADKSADEARLLGAWKYSKNTAVLHTDASLMPRIKSCWASWNYLETANKEHQSTVALTYDMTRLIRLKGRNRYFVSLNPVKEISDLKIVREFKYMHPQYTAESIATQHELPKLNGVNRTFFCGSYFTYGFHEDAVASAVTISKHLGVQWPN